MSKLIEKLSDTVRIEQDDAGHYIVYWITDTGSVLHEAYISLARARRSAQVQVRCDATHKAAAMLGSIRTPKKAASSRANGLKGGRPKKS